MKNMLKCKKDIIIGGVKLEAFKTSKEMWTEDEADVYVEERTYHHEEIISTFLEDNEKARTKEVFLVGGGSGAGKSSFIEDLLMDVSQENGDYAHIINADDIKYHIEEFRLWEEFMQEPSFFNIIDCEDKSDFVHDESSDISMFMINESVNHNMNFIYDGTFKNPKKYADLLKLLIDNGYSIGVFIIDVELKTALERVKARNVEGRFVPDNVVIESNFKVAETFFKLKNQLPSYVLYNNSFGRGKIKLVAEFSEEDGEIIHDKELYRDFKKKAQLSRKRYR